jgi:hypothetical protein
VQRDERIRHEPCTYSELCRAFCFSKPVNAASLLLSEQRGRHGI